MGMTITEKILAAHAGRDAVSPGENIWCNVDVLMSNDVIAPQMIGVFEEEFGFIPPVVSPAPPVPPGEVEAPFELCYEVNVLRFGEGYASRQSRLLIDGKPVAATFRPVR